MYVDLPYFYTQRGEENNEMTAMLEFQELLWWFNSFLMQNFLLFQEICIAAESKNDRQGNLNITNGQGTGKICLL